MWGMLLQPWCYFYRYKKLSKNSYPVYTYYAMCSIRVLGQLEVYSIPSPFLSLLKKASNCKFIKI